MSRRFWLTLFIASLLLYGLSQQNIGRAANLNSGLPSRQLFVSRNQTVPTRTATPGPTSPSSPVPPTATKSGGGENPTAVPTSTSIPPATATTTRPPTLVFTPVSGFVPTAAPCSSQPTIQTQNPTNVRSGPGSDYEIINTLAFLEVRPIIGRAAAAPWWWIQISSSETGWVADQVVTVQGYIGRAPIVAAPERNDRTPTSGAPWQPTVSPLCTVTPTATAEAAGDRTTTPTTAAAIVTDTAVTESPPTSAAAGSLPAPTATNAPQPTQTAVSPPTLAPTAPSETGDNQTIGRETAVTPLAAAPLNDEPANSPVDLLLLLGGLLLLIAGVVTVVAKRKGKESQ